MKMPKRLQHLSWKKLGDFTLILDSKGLNQAHQLNDVGSIIWEFCDGDKTQKDLEEYLAKIYTNHTPAQISSDIEIYLKQLSDKKLIEF